MESKVPFTVTAAPGAPTTNAETSALLQRATDRGTRRTSVKQSEELLTSTKTFAAAYASGDAATAQALYAPLACTGNASNPSRSHLAI